MAESRSVRNFETQLRELAKVFLGEIPETEYALNKEITRIPMTIETFSGQIRLDDRTIYVEWECSRPKLYIRTLIDIFARLL